MNMLISGFSPCPFLNQEMWADSLGGRWRLPVPCGHSISESRWHWFPVFSQSGRGDSAGLHLVGFQEEAVWQRVSRKTRWTVSQWQFKGHTPPSCRIYCQFLFLSSPETSMSSLCVQCPCPLTLPLKDITEERFCVLDLPYWRPKTTCHW